MPGAWEDLSSPHILVATPIRQYVSIEWAYHFAGIRYPGKVEFRAYSGCPIDVARNRLVKDALELKVKYIYWVDGDVFPPQGVVFQLLSHHLPIVSGLYLSKHGTPAMWIKNPTKPGYDPIMQYESNKLYKVDAIPMGCCLMDIRVFEKIPYPWFKWTIEDPLDQKTGLSEDFSFSVKAQEYGFDLYVDTSVAAFHEMLVRMDTQAKYQLER